MKIICFKKSLDSFFVRLSLRTDFLYKVYFDIDNKIKKVKLVNKYFDNTTHSLDNVLNEYSSRIIIFDDIDKAIEYLSKDNIDRVYSLLEGIKCWSEYDANTIKQTIHHRDAFLENYVAKSDEELAEDYFND